MRADELDEVLKMLLAPVGEVLGAFNECQRTPEKFPALLLQRIAALKDTVNRIPRTGMRPEEVDAFVTFDDMLSDLQKNISVEEAGGIPRLRNEFKRQGIKFLTELSIANKYVSGMPNFMELEEMFS